MKTIKISVIVIIVFAIAVIGFLAYPKKIQKPQQYSQDIIRQRDIAEIKKFSNNQDINIEFTSTSKSSYDLKVPVNVYTSGVDQYELDANTGKIIQFEARDLPVGSEVVKKEENVTAYTQAELEAKARQFVAEKAPDINLDLLTANHGNKDKNYFFRWEDRTRKTTEGYLFIQVGFTQGGSLLNYINAL